MQGLCLQSTEYPKHNKVDELWFPCFYFEEMLERIGFENALGFMDFYGERDYYAIIRRGVKWADETEPGQAQHKDIFKYKKANCCWNTYLS